jgi:U2 small nuclear ribonucleoprotein B''
MSNCDLRVLYINNLNERVNSTELEKALLAIFSHFGKIEKIFTSKTYRTRGQAWLTFRDEVGATEALASMQNFLFYSKPMKLARAKNSKKGNPDKVEILDADADKGILKMDINGKHTRKRSKTAHGIGETVSKTLFVEGLPEATTEHMLSILFKQFIGFLEVRKVADKQGLAFVAFTTAKEAGNALNGLQGFRINSTHTMQLSYADE